MRVVCVRIEMRTSFLRRSVVSVLGLTSTLVACGGARSPSSAIATPPAPAAAPAQPGAELPEPCRWQAVAAPALPGTTVPTTYPFPLPPRSDARTNDAVCAKIGTACAGIETELGLGKVARIALKTAPPATGEDAWLRIARDALVAAGPTFGIHQVPDAWQRSPSGVAYFAIAPRDGIGFVAAERPGPDGVGHLSIEGITGVDLGTARLLDRREVAARFVGRAFCGNFPTGRFEEHEMVEARACDPSVGDPNSCDHAVEKKVLRVPQMETRVLGTAAEEDFRLMLALDISGLQVVYVGHGAFDAFTGASVSAGSAMVALPVRPE